MNRPPTKQDTDAARREWETRWEQSDKRPVILPPGPPTAWQSLPPFIRFAVWLWAICTVACLALGWLVVVAVMGLR